MFRSSTKTLLQRNLRYVSNTTKKLVDVKPSKPITPAEPKAKIKINPSSGETTIVKPTTVPIPLPPKKKKFSFSGFILKSLLAAGVVYGGTLYLATKSDKVMDFVIDKQLPYYEEIIDIYEKGSIDDLKAYLTKLQTKVTSVQLKFPSKDQFNELTSKSEKIFEETKSKFSSKPEVNVAEFGKDATPAQQLQKPVEAVQKVIEHLPLIKLNKGVESSVDESVKQTIESFNDLIRSIDVGSQGTAGKEALIKAISDNVSVLAGKLNNLTSSFDKELQDKLKNSQTDLLSSFTKKELELTETLLDQFNREKSQLEAKLNERLNHEIDTSKQAISQAAVNAVTMMRIEQTRQFEQVITDRINQERNGRLSDLDKLNDRLKELEEFSVNLENQLVSNHNNAVFSKSVANLKHALASSGETDVPKALINYFDQIDKLAGAFNNELITLTLKDLKPLVSEESTHSILTNTQLLNKWEELAPELRSASLLPPNAGLLGHVASIVFSKLLMPVKGARPNGKDIESVIGRIEASLARGDLDLAVEDAANLKGWPRKLADDWVKQGRKRLEVQFLVSVLESESRIV